MKAKRYLATFLQAEFIKKIGNLNLEKPISETDAMKKISTKLPDANPIYLGEEHFDKAGNRFGDKIIQLLSDSNYVDIGFYETIVHSDLLPTHEYFVSCLNKNGIETYPLGGGFSHNQ